jgi:hypothetical protein
MICAYGGEAAASRVNFEKKVVDLYYCTSRFRFRGKGVIRRNRMRMAV